MNGPVPFQRGHLVHKNLDASTQAGVSHVFNASATDYWRLTA